MSTALVIILGFRFNSTFSHSSQRVPGNRRMPLVRLAAQRRCRGESGCFANVSTRVPTLQQGGSSASWRLQTKKYFLQDGFNNSELYFDSRCLKKT